MNTAKIAMGAIEIGSCFAGGLAGGVAGKAITRAVNPETVWEKTGILLFDLYIADKVAAHIKDPLTSVAETIFFKEELLGTPNDGSSILDVACLFENLTDAVTARTLILLAVSQNGEMTMSDMYKELGRYSLSSTLNSSLAINKDADIIIHKLTNGKYVMEYRNLAVVRDHAEGEVVNVASENAGK